MAHDVTRFVHDQQSLVLEDDPLRNFLGRDHPHGPLFLRSTRPCARAARVVIVGL
jgi:hypothetical protein